MLTQNGQACDCHSICLDFYTFNLDTVSVETNNGDGLGHNDRWVESRRQFKDIANFGKLEGLLNCQAS